MPPKQLYNIGHRICCKCKTIVHIMFPEEGAEGSTEWFSAKQQYLDDYVRSFGWSIKDGRLYCANCVKSMKEE